MRSTTQSRSSARSLNVDDCGHLYLLRFDNGVIKVGRSVNPAARNSRHRREAGRFDLRIVDQWQSNVMNHVQLAERRLIAVLTAIGSRTPGGREYFRDIPFSIARYQAERLHQIKLSECCCGNCVEPLTVRTNAYIGSTPREDENDSNRLVFDVRLSCGTVIAASIEDAFEPDEKARLDRGDRFEIDIDPRPWGGVWMAWIL